VSKAGPFSFKEFNEVAGARRRSLLPRRVGQVAIVVFCSFFTMACSLWLHEKHGNHNLFWHSRVRLDERIVRSDPYLHKVFTKTECEGPDSQFLFAFIAGDGRSWIRAGRVSADPTPTRALAIELMRRADSCGFVISRPCSFGLVEIDPSCEPSVWTTRRYSEDVIRSTAGVISQELGSRRGLILVGVSGGGRIAAHVAARMPEVDAVVTLGTNLDLPGWLDHHGYTREILSYSAPIPGALRSGLISLHVVGTEDAVSPPELTRAWLENRPQGESLLELEGVDHGEGWIDAWPGVRDRVQQLSESSARRRSSSSTR